MIILESTLFTLFLIINATVPAQNVPLDIGTPEVAPSDTTTSAAQTPISSSNPVLDTATITAIIAALGGLFVAWKKGSSNDNAIADTITNLKESLKATDKGAADNAAIIARIAENTAKADPKLAEALKECKVAATENAKEWNEDLKGYYELHKPAGPDDLHLNKTKAKLAVVNKETEKTELPS